MNNPTQKVWSDDCPECGTIVRFHSLPKKGQITVCPECGEKLEVVSLSPFELDWAYEEENYAEGDDY